MLNWIALYGHRWLGLAAGGVVMVMALTGSMLAWKDPLISALNPRLAQISTAFAAGAKPLPLTELLPPLLSRSTATLSRVIIDPSGERPSTLRFTPAPGKECAFDPYSGAPIDSIRGQATFRFIQEIHQHLAAGRYGKALTGATALIVLGLSFSGPYLFLRRRGWRWRGGWRIERRFGWRSSLRQLHALLGIGSFALFLIMAMTGLYLSYGWYHRGAQILLAGPHAAAFDHPPPRQAKISRMTMAAWQNALDQLCSRRTIDLRVVSSEDFWANIHCLSQSPRAKQQFTGVIYVHKDQIIVRYPLAQESVGQRLLVQIVSLHSGQLFGTVSRLLWMIAAIALVIIGATGWLTFRISVPWSKQQTGHHSRRATHDRHS